jgi:hypothetical protein
MLLTHSEWPHTHHVNEVGLRIVNVITAVTPRENTHTHTHTHTHTLLVLCTTGL